MKKFAGFLLALMLCVVLAVSAVAKDNMGENDEGNPSPRSEFSAASEIGKEGTKEGSALSEGDLTILVGTVCAVVFGLGGFFVGKAAGKKKKPALVSGENKDEE